MTPQILRIATRKSPLALAQAEQIKAALEQLHPHVQCQIVGMTTSGDQQLAIPLAEVGGKALFVKELELALLAGQADLAVHSMKDVPVDLAPGLNLFATCERADPHDAFVSNHFSSLDDLPLGARVGTSSLRRQCQLRVLRPDLQMENLRGNIHTRLNKLDEGEFDAIVLAAAGLQRLQCHNRIRQIFSATQCTPAVGQGALAIECGEADKITQTLIAPLNHPSSFYCVQAERALNTVLNGGCQTPIAAYATLHADTIYLRAMVGRADGSLIIRAQKHGPVQQAVQIGQALAKDLLDQGADKILSGKLLS